MDARKGLMLTVVLGLTVAGGACASGAAGSGGTMTGSTGVMPGAATLGQGVSPTENEHTKAADRHLDDAEDARTPDEARAQYQMAFDAAQQAIALDERNPLGHLLAARAAMGLENYVAAGHHFDRAEELRPIYQLQTEGVREQAWIQLYQEAAPFVSSGDYESAAEIFENANAIYQRRPEVMITLGQIYASMGEADKAVENLRMAQALIASERIEEMDSATAAEWREQGEQIPEIITQALLQARQYEAAAVELRRIVAEDPSNTQYLQLLGNVYAQMDQPDSARVIFGRLMGGHDLTSQQFYQIGVGFYQMEEWLQAAGAFRRAAEISVKDRDAIELWARSLQIANQDAGDDVEVPEARMQELMDATSRWIELDPHGRNAYLIRAQAANKMGDGAMARELVQRIEGLKVTVQDLQLRRRQGGGATLNGSVRNLTATPGGTATVRVTFYDDAGAPIGTESVQVPIAAKDAAEIFRVEIDTDRAVGGYSYELTL